ncbi:MAG: YeiH family protein [Candidatus Weimeria sp.]
MYKKSALFIGKNIAGILLCLAIAVPSWLLGKQFPVVGGAVIGILAGMAVTVFWKNKGIAENGIKWTSKYILQAAVVLLGFGMDLGVIAQTGKESLPIIVCTISTSLLIAWLLHKALHVTGNTSVLVGVGSSICGGSAIAAAAPVVGAADDEVAQSISTIFFFNVLAAIFFPMLGRAIGFDTTSGDAFGVFAGTAVNDTSSVTAAASTWDSMYGLGSQTLDKAVTVKLTRTLAIIPITLVLALIRASRAKKEGVENSGEGFSFRRAFPMFILYFTIAAVITTVCVHAGVDVKVFTPLKELSKFFIVMAMAAIGLNSDIVKLIRTGGKPILIGASCWAGITLVSLLMQHILHIW